MFGEKTNDRLVTGIVTVLGMGIIGSMGIIYQIKSDMKFLQEHTNTSITTLKKSVDKLEGKVNILIAHLQSKSKSQTLKQNEILKLISLKENAKIQESNSTLAHSNIQKDINSTFCDINKTQINLLEKLAIRKVGKRYVWGNNHKPNSSYFVKKLYNKLGINIPETPIKQSKYGKYVSRVKLRKGDLVFFSTSKTTKYVNHVGLYIGNGKFIHADSAKNKVVKSDLSMPFFKERYISATRISNKICN